MVSRCAGRNAAGEPCQAQPVRPSGYCYWHDDAIATERDRKRREGGANRSNASRARRQLPAGVMTTDELRGLLGLTIRGALGGRVEPGVANAVANLSRAYIQATESGAVEALQAEVDELRAMVGRGRSA